MLLSIIVAIADNGVIGRNNSLPWTLPGDLIHFKEITMGKPIIMGRKTFESIGNPLPGRKNIVITRNRKFSSKGVTIVHDLAVAIESGYSVALENGVGEVMIIGGANIYIKALPLANRLYVTEVHSDIEGDVTFPKFNQAEWSEVSRHYQVAGPKETCNYSFVLYDRVGGCN
tara:strand:+ start:213 stop:728 length:516 start_codon:yes stop_codon:yes gene_type:complete